MHSVKHFRSSIIFYYNQIISKIILIIIIYDNHILNKKFKSAYISRILIDSLNKLINPSLSSRDRKYDFSSSLWIRNDPFNREARHGGIIAIGASWQIQSKLSNFRPHTPTLLKEILRPYFSPVNDDWSSPAISKGLIMGADRSTTIVERNKRSPGQVDQSARADINLNERAAPPNEQPSHINFIAIS